MPVGRGLKIPGISYHLWGGLHGGAQLNIKSILFTSISVHHTAWDKTLPSVDG